MKTKEYLTSLRQAFLTFAAIALLGFGIAACDNGTSNVAAPYNGRATTGYTNALRLAVRIVGILTAVVLAVEMTAISQLARERLR